MYLKNETLLITGASGALGKQLVYECHKRGIKPICHVRKDSDTNYIDSLGFEKRTADLRNQRELADLVSGVDRIIHTAAWVNFRKDRLTQFTGTNTIGALDLFKAASHADVKRFLHVSTVAAIGAIPYAKKKNNHFESHDYKPMDETWEFNIDHLQVPYIMTKRAAELELTQEAQNSKTELVTVNPSIIAAPSRSGDSRGAALRKFFKSFILPDLGNVLNLVDIRDVAHGIFLAMEKGKPNERYILAGDNLTGRDLALITSALLGKVPHLVRFPRRILKPIARIAAYTKFINKEWSEIFYPDLVRMLDYDWGYSSNKARRELGYNYRSIHVTLNELLNNGFSGTWLKPE